MAGGSEAALAVLKIVNKYLERHRREWFHRSGKEQIIIDVVGGYDVLPLAD